MHIPFCFSTYTSANGFKATRQLTSLLVQGVSPCTSLRVADMLIGKPSWHTGRHASVADNAHPSVSPRAKSCSPRRPAEGKLKLKQSQPAQCGLTRKFNSVFYHPNDIYRKQSII